jgi:membrane-associated HD superfamily phosphohydrolase
VISYKKVVSLLIIHKAIVDIMATSIRKISVPLLIVFFALNVLGAGAAHAQEATNCTVRADLTASEVTEISGGEKTDAIDAGGTPLDLNDGASSLLCTFSLIKYIANILFLVVTAVAVLLLFYAAFLYVTAGANTARTTQGKQVLMYAIIGLLLAAVARVIPSVVQGLIGLG